MKDMIGKYVKKRVVNDVECVGCGRSENEKVKRIRFGKMKYCL
jgi:Zn ribbon nucleic-acid-binding protein